MYQPPPYPVKKGPNWPLILTVGAVFICLPCAIGGYFLYTVGGKAIKGAVETVLPTVSCAMNFDAARQGVLDYANAHDGKLPNAKTWQDDIEPYYRAAIEKEIGKEKGEFMGMSMKPTPFVKASKWTCKAGSLETGIEYNSELSEKKLADITSKKDTVLFFEVPKTGINLADKYTPQPKSKAPMMYGQHRDWLIAYVEGDSVAKDIKVKNGRGWNVDVKEESGK